MKENINFIDSDVLIIGSGIAGLMAALEAARKGAAPLLLSKSPVGRATNTNLAGGGFVFSTAAFSPARHIENTMHAGRMLNDPELVRRFVENAPGEVEKLLKMGLQGYRHDKGFSCRISGFIGGPQLSSILVRCCQKAGVRFHENVFVTDLISGDQACRGVIGFDKRRGDWYGIRSKAVILASGGAGAIYAQNDNAPGSTGDGYVLGLEAGLELFDIEFVQFYPLAYAGSGHAGIIIPPAFADLGRIVNRLGEDIAEKYQIQERPLAAVSRDRLSQAMFREIRLGNDIDGALLLDLQRADWSRLPYSDQTKALFRKKIPFDSQPVKITPVCHHTMGGLAIDPDGRTALKGLFAAGEVVGGIHGANRMGGNALSESLVFGAICGKKAADYAGSLAYDRDFESKARACAAKRFRLMGENGKTAAPTAAMKTIKKLLWEKVGIIRDERALTKGIQELENSYEAAVEVRAGSPGELCRLMECRNAALIGKAVALAALERTESRGAHYRNDFPNENREWARRIHVKMKNDTPFISRIQPAHNSNLLAES